jgi:hypothetical protein
MTTDWVAAEGTPERVGTPALQARLRRTHSQGKAAPHARGRRPAGGCPGGSRGRQPRPGPRHLDGDADLLGQHAPGAGGRRRRHQRTRPRGQPGRARRDRVPTAGQALRAGGAPHRHQLAVGSSGQVEINAQGDASTVRHPWTLTTRGDSAYRVRWSVPLIGYVAVAFQNHRGLALLGAGIVLIVIAGTLVSGSRRRSRRRDEGDGASMGQGDPRPGASAQVMRIRQATPMRWAVSRQPSTSRSPILTMKNDPCLSRVGCPA